MTDVRPPSPEADERLDPARLRADLLAEVRGRGTTVTGTVAAALLSVPRHVFVPEVPVGAAYRDEAIVVKRDADGVPISSSSQPTIVALMLDQLAPAPGHRVLEIGAGSGYNAALLAHLVGPAGSVFTVDIDTDAVARARAALGTAGYPDVTVVYADGGDGYPPAAPYDRIIATVGVWDLAPAWLDQLAPGGRLVVPLSLRGAQVSVAFEREDDRWVSRSLVPCGFMRLRGPSAGPERRYILDRAGGMVLGVSDDRPVDIDALRAAVGSPPVTRLAGVAGRADGTGGNPAATGVVSLWLAISDSRTCTLSDEDGGAAALAAAPMRGRGFRETVGLVDGTGMALLSLRGDELLVHGYGPDGERLADELAGHIRSWDVAGRPGPERLRITGYPFSAPVGVGGLVVDKTHTHLVVTAL